MISSGLVLNMADVKASAEQPQWQQDLADQMADEYVCMIGYLSRVIEREIDGAPLVQARVHCLDGRAYDTRRHKEAWFSIEPCQKTKLSC